MQSVIDAINEKAKVEIDETYTKEVPKAKKFTTFDSIVPKMANFNHQADVLILKLSPYAAQIKLVLFLYELYGPIKNEPKLA